MENGRSGRSGPLSRSSLPISASFWHEDAGIASVQAGQPGPLPSPPAGGRGANAYRHNGSSLRFWGAIQPRAKSVAAGLLKTTGLAKSGPFGEQRFHGCQGNRSGAVRAAAAGETQFFRRQLLRGPRLCGSAPAVLGFHRRGRRVFSLGEDIQPGRLAELCESCRTGPLPPNSPATVEAAVPKPPQVRACGFLHCDPADLQLLGTEAMVPAGAIYLIKASLEAGRPTEKTRSGSLPACRYRGRPSPSGVVRTATGRWPSRC